MCRLVSHFTAYPEPPIPRGTTLVFIADNGAKDTELVAQAKMGMVLEETRSADLQPREVGPLMVSF